MNSCDTKSKFHLNIREQVSCCITHVFKSLGTFIGVCFSEFRVDAILHMIRISWPDVYDNELVWED